MSQRWARYAGNRAHGQPFQQILIAAIALPAPLPNDAFVRATHQGNLFSSTSRSNIAAAAIPATHMRIVVSCPCGQRFQTDSRHAGKLAECSQCGNPLTIPNARSRWVDPVDEAGIRVLCACGCTFNAPEASEGSSVPCPRCEGLTLVPHQDPLGLRDLPGFSEGTSSHLQPLVRSLDTTERWARRSAFWACGSVALLAVAILLTSVINNFGSTARQTMPDQSSRTLLPTSPNSEASKSIRETDNGEHRQAKQGQVTGTAT